MGAVESSSLENIDSLSSALERIEQVCTINLNGLKYTVFFCVCVVVIVAVAVDVDIHT